MADRGQCLDMTSDFPLRYRTASGNRAVANSLIRRLQNRTGYLAAIAPGYAPEAGFDLRALLNAGLSAAGLAAARSRIAQEALADERVLTAEVEATLDQGTLTVEIAMSSADGPFRLVIAVTSDEFTAAYFES